MAETGHVEQSLGLPHGFQDYLRSPSQTWEKAIKWLNARWQLRACTRVGRWTRVSGRMRVSNQGEIIVGERVQLHSHYVPSIFVVSPGGRLEIGDRTALNYGADIGVTKLVKIGSDCGIGTHLIVFDNNFHDLKDRSKVPESQPVIIGDRVWIGARVTILPGVSIGDDAVIGAGSVVMTDIPGRSLAMGNPARVIQKL